MFKIVARALVALTVCCGLVLPSAADPVSNFQAMVGNNITPNGQNKITGAGLNATLNSLVPIFSSMGTFDSSGNFTLRPTAVPPLSPLLDLTLGSTPGLIACRSPSGWTGIPAAAPGTVLTSVSSTQCPAYQLPPGPSASNIPGIACDGVTDNYTAINAAAAISSVIGANLIFPPGQCLINMSTGRTAISVRGGIQGATIGGFSQALPNHSGTVFLIRGTSDSPFSLANRTNVRDVTFVWPDQTNPSSPIAYPAALNLPATNNIVIQNVTMANAYTGINIASGSGYIWVNKCKIAAFGNHIAVGTVAAENWFTDNSYSYGWGYDFYNNLGLLQSWINAYEASSIAINFTGKQADAQVISNNVFFAQKAGINVSHSGEDAYLWATISGNHFDATFQGLVFNGTARPQLVTVTGNTYEFFGPNPVGSSFVAMGMSNSGAEFDISITGNRISVSTGGQISITAPSGQNGSVGISGNTMFYPGFQQTSGSYNMVYINGGATDVAMSGNVLDGASSSTAGSGVYAQTARSVTIGTNTFKTMSTAVTLGSVVTAVINGNSGVNVAAGVSGTAALIRNANNSWN